VARCHCYGKACEPPLFAWRRLATPVLLSPLEDPSASPREVLVACAKAVLVVMTVAETMTGNQILTPKGPMPPLVAAAAADAAAVWELDLAAVPPLVLMTVP